MNSAAARGGSSAPKIGVRRVYDPPLPDDGLRVLVDRLWPRGLSKAAAQVELWLKEIAPSDELRRWFGHDPERWEDFKSRYFSELRQNESGLAELRSKVEDSPRITLLFAAKDTQFNNAVALKEFLQEHFKA